MAAHSHYLKLYIFNLIICFKTAGIEILSLQLTSVIETNKGPVRGEILTSADRKIKFSSFRGIRYGKPPIGNLRFKPPVEADPWTNIFDATSEGNSCPQTHVYNPNIYSGFEDCLNLNVYTPKTYFSSNYDNANNCSSSDGLLPVMVWIFGGAFTFGDIKIGFHGPDYFIENDVVVVVISYRLGLLGFLSLDLPEATGNAGLKDQILALKWVNKNIKKFGGNPNNVTIFGISSGASSVDYHILSDKSQGLFHRSISMSGSSLCFWSITTTPQIQNYAYQVAHNMGYTVNNNTELLKLLQNESAEKMIKAAAKITSNKRPFKPVIENENIAGDSAFITKCFIEKFKTGNFNRLPHMMGFMAQEAILYLAPLTKLKQNVRELRNKVTVSVDDFPSNLSPTVEYMFGGSTKNIFSNIINNSINQLVQNLTDLLYTSAFDMKQKMMQQYTRIYYYRNTMNTNVSYHKIYNGVDVEGASHGDDMLYLWHNSHINLPSDPHHPYNIGRYRLIKLWTNFAKYSNPTPLGNDDPLLNVTWTESGPGGYYLDISNNGLTMMQTRPINDNIKNIQQDYFTVFEKYTGCQ
ncbi:juvenile hormone esterase isoform X2 [Microplitis demolitor]|uniref:juvenile hormone esterase isoform X2 n=1 Tax=Microplitis demolitor TaxID=69319 RepID=UPI0006D4F4DB|nr:juvenile hormone esterase isoform X2 [Microplitis demolitor]